MEPQQLIKAAAVTRVVFGTSALVAPRTSISLFLGPDARTPAASVIGRALGARDALVGGMLLHTAGHPQIGQRWTATCAAVDAIDGVAALLAVRQGLPRAGGIAFAAVALGSAVTHAVLARGAGDSGSETGSGSGSGPAAASSSDEAAAVATPPEPASSPETVYPDGSQEAMRSMGARTQGRIPAPDES